jgi:hypothetical protein
MKVCLQPCLAIDSPLGEVARQACYLVHEQVLGPEKTDLGCLPALAAGVEEDVLFVRTEKVLAIEACEARCSGILAERNGGFAAATLFVGPVLEAAGIEIGSLPRKHLPLDHPAVVAMANVIRATAEELLAEGDDGDV